MADINLAHFIPYTTNEGPGKRAAIWVQGCHFDCPGCCNPELQPFELANLVNVDSIFEKINKAANLYELEGGTLLGGEPLLQAKGLAVLAEKCQSIGLSVMVFTGFKLERLKKKPLLGSEQLLSLVDVLVDGLYLKDQAEEIRNWSGSKNQNFHYLSNRYDSSIEIDPSFQPTIEIAVKQESIRVSGYPL